MSRKPIENAETEKEETQREKILREQKEYKAKIPKLTEEWIEKGHKILEENYWPEWDKLVPISLGSRYKGIELKACLEIIEQLNDNCDLSEAEDIFVKQNHSGASNMLVKEMVKMFCVRGKEFAKFISDF